MQTYGVLSELAQHHSLTHGLIMGGANRQAEVTKLAKGVNIIVASPGRLLDHLQVHRRFSVTVYKLHRPCTFYEFEKATNSTKVTYNGREFYSDSQPTPQSDFQPLSSRAPGLTFVRTEVQ